MTDRKTLQIKPASEQDDTAPAIRKKGRGWEISESRLDTLHDRAREMRRNPGEAHKALADKFAEADLGKYSFKRFAVVGSAIVDFNCHNLGMAIDIEDDVSGEGENATLLTRRDKSLEAVGIKVMRIKASDILGDMDAVLDRITAGMRIRIGERREARTRHFEQKRGTGQGYKPRNFRAGPRD